MRGLRVGAHGLAALAACGLLGACGQDRQDAKESSGSYRMEIVDASFPKDQSIAERQKMRITVRNTDDKTIPIVAVTVATEPSSSGGAPIAFGSDIADAAAADAARPIWIVDQPPQGGTTAVTNTWALGSLKAGQTKAFEWQVTPVKAGSYTIDYSTSPSLTGKATAARGDTSGRFRVTVSDVPPDARIGDDGEVITSPGSAD